MKFLWQVWKMCELPLLVKELNEQAARPRTYVIRFLYAATLFAAACIMFYGDVISVGGSTGALGRGREMFERLVDFQFWSIYLFLPAVSCGALTIEKERNTLALLLITSLRPWQIVVQKVLGRVVPMLTYLLLSFPLMAVAYSFGGITEDYLWSGILLLVLTCFQVGALAIACSAYFATTVEAFIANYVAFLVLRGVLPFAWGPYLFQRAADVPFAVTALSTFLMVSLTVAFLLLAWGAVESRAFVSPKNVLLGLFRWLDANFNEMNKITGGIVLVKDGDPLPGTRPIAWRETAKKSLGTFRYLFRVLVVVELPLLLLCNGLRFSGPGGASLQPISMALYLLWMLAVALTIVHAGSVISAERTRQTLDVLLATPLLGREILLQKLQGVRRLFGVLLVPFVTIFAFETWWNQGATNRWVYPLLALATVAAYLPLAAWVALWAGLKMRSQMKAIFAAMGLIGAWLIIPALVLGLAAALAVPPDGALRKALLLNPVQMIPAVERVGEYVLDARDFQRAPSPDWLMLTANLLLHVGALWALRRHVLERADRLLGRLGEESPPRREQPQIEPSRAPVHQMAT
ncbi:MAG: ABC transporter permease [Planctomycetaceae bacterium]